MTLDIEPYLEQAARWPQEGRHILAQYNDTEIVVYQAFRPEIGDHAARFGRFGDQFSLSRMSWIKPNFLWMMYRCGWGTKPGQEVVLAIHLRRSAFDDFLGQSVQTTFTRDVYSDEASWKAQAEQAEALVQWDPDHDPTGDKLQRRAIQIGLRGRALARYAREAIVDIEDISTFVCEQHALVLSREWLRLLTPREAIYPVIDGDVAARLGLP